jgi:hypothetical protein
VDARPACATVMAGLGPAIHAFRAGKCGPNRQAAALSVRSTRSAREW